MAATPFSQIVNGASQNHSINPPRLPPPAFLACNLINQLETNSQLLEETSCYPGAVLLHSQQKTSRRSAVLGGVSTSAAAAITLLITQTITPPVSLAIVEKEKETDSNNNGWWLTGPLPVPTVTNKELANGETGTRSFLRNGIYMANVGVDGSAFRLREYAFDLLALGDLMGKDSWNYMRKYLCLKSTFMYLDFDKVISAASVENKQSLLDLAVRFFDSVEDLEEAIKKQDDGMIETRYNNTTQILHEVRAKMA
ncbi:PsbQ-like 1 [Zostera marina]|uniref:PsbQ-like 1 n=1 Tax=Zostera marina TaxID=29655 RepID=A0A0K9PN83_ZOSMR|nr:PsbQ-like 1 [Zostera marina]